LYKISNKSVHWTVSQSGHCIILYYSLIYYIHRPIPTYHEKIYTPSVKSIPNPAYIIFALKILLPVIVSTLTDALAQYKLKGRKSEAVKTQKYNIFNVCNFYILHGLKFYRSTWSVGYDDIPMRYTFTRNF